MTRFDLTPLSNACRRLAEGLVRYEGDTSDVQIRDGLVQRFEFTYEIARKMIARYLDTEGPTPGEVDHMAFGDVIRSANEQGLLLGTWKEWKLYRDMRSRTSHTYDEEVALEVVAAIPGFLAEAEHLLRRLEERNV